MRFFQNHRWLAVLIFIIFIAIAAYLFQDAIRQIFIQPLSYLWWQVNILYKSVAQIVYLALLLVLVLGISASSLLVRSPKRFRYEKPRRTERGPVEEMAWWLTHSSKRGTYFKWRVAHRLAELAVRVNERENLPRRLPASLLLSSKDWSPSGEIQEYLVAGLERRLIEPGRVFLGLSKHTHNPYDIDVENVVAYLETRMELNRDRKPS